MGIQHHAMILGSLALVVAAASGQALSQGAKAAANGPSLPMGAFECWGNGSPRMLMNFTVTAPGKYTGSDGSKGTFTLTAENHVMFTGIVADSLPQGYYAVFGTPQGKPTVSFRSERGSEAAFCEKV